MAGSQLTPGQQAILQQVSNEAAAPTQEKSTRRRPLDLKSLPDTELARLISLLQQESEERAIAACDPEALTTRAFHTMFTGRGEAMQPELDNGILVCAGSLRRTSATGHECTFVNVGGEWSWQHPDMLDDTVRKSPGKGGMDDLKTVTLIPVTDGTQVDLVTSKASSRDGHKAKKVVSYTVSDGDLEITTTRTPAKMTPSR